MKREMNKKYEERKTRLKEENEARWKGTYSPKGHTELQSQIIRSCKESGLNTADVLAVLEKTKTAILEESYIKNRD